MICYMTPQDACKDSPAFVSFSLFFFVKVRKSKQRTPRQNSNVFAVFDKQQIKEFKEAFRIMDADGDEMVDAKDLQITLERIGNL